MAGDKGEGNEACAERVPCGFGRPQIIQLSNYLLTLHLAKTPQNLEKGTLMRQKKGKGERVSKTTPPKIRHVRRRRRRIKKFDDVVDAAGADN